jgi:acetyl esterase/lipase
VVICPGGGYGMESYRLEGTNIAEAFVKKGIAAFILKYRLPSDSIMPDKSVGPLQDAQQAIKTVRQRAEEWKLNPSKLGIMGFSAGGHLASTVGTHFNKSYIQNDENISLRPDFMILIYPVISMKEGLTHGGSKTNLLGKTPSEEQIALFSNELQVNANTPPTWITHTGDDTVVPVENSIRFYQELIRNKVPAEMHLYPAGNHGFVLKLPTDEWMQPLFGWMQKSGITK